MPPGGPAGRRRWPWVVGGVAGLALVVALVVVLVLALGDDDSDEKSDAKDETTSSASASDDASTSDAAEPSEPSGPTESSGTADGDTGSDTGSATATDVGVAIGTPDAPHAVVIYEDFLCPYCQQLEESTRDQLAALALAGKVYVEYRPFDLLSRLGDYPIRATSAFAVVLEESGPDVAKRFHDLLYENQPSESEPDTVTNDDLVDLAVQAGATEADVRPGIESVAQRAWVTRATDAAMAAGVQGTPWVLLDGNQFQDGSTVPELATNLLAELE